MRTSALRLLVLCSFAALCFTPLAAGSANAANTPTSQAVSGFQGCTLAATKPVDVLIIMDQTQSLRTTDPGNLRIIGLKAALRSMASEHDTNANVTYRVKMVGFGRSVIAYNSGAGLGSWSSVTSDTLSSLYQSTSIFAQPATGDLGVVTDFSAALEYADATLSQSPSPCRAVLWFTDGALDLSNNGQLFPATSIEKRAMQAICKPGGLASSLANNNIWNFAVGLTNHTGAKGAGALASIARGGSSNYLYAQTCGLSTEGLSSSASTGEFFQSPNSAGLIFQMQGLVCTGASCEPQTLESCTQGAICPANHQFPFWVGPGVASFTFDGLVSGVNFGSGSPQFQLTDAATNESIVMSIRSGRQSCALPNGTPTACLIDGVVVSASSLTANEIRVVGRVTGATAPGHSLRGVYLLPAGTSGSVHYTFFLKSSLDLSFVPNQTGTPECPAPAGNTAYIGCTIAGHIELVDAKTRKPIADTQSALHDVRATLISNKQDFIPISVPTSSGSAIPYSITIPDTATIGVRYLQATGVLQLSQGGVPQASIDVSLQQPLTLVPAPGFPVVSVPRLPTTVNVGDEFSVPIRVTGSARGDGGCVSLGQTKPALHAGQDIQITSLRTSFPRSCESIGNGRTETFLVKGQLTKGSNGHFAISLALRLGSADKGQTFEAPTVSIDMQANVPVNVGGSIFLLVLFIALAMLGILLMSLLVNSVTGRFAPRNLILAKTVEAQYSDGSLHGPDGVALEIGSLLSENTIDYSPSRVRSFSINANGTFLDFEASNLKKPTTWVRGLFRGPQASVSARGGEIVVGGSSVKLSGPTSGTATIRQDLNETWIFTVSNVEGGENSEVDAATGVRRPLVVTGNLTVLVRSGGGPSALSRLQSNAESGMSDTAKRFKAKSRLVGSLSATTSSETTSVAMSQDLSSTTEPDIGI